MGGAAEDQLLSFEEISKHNKKFDCWIIISGKVYDVTPFLDDHPGGDEILLMATAKDATDDFDDVNHSEEAVGMLKSYHIGNVDTSTLPGKHQYNQTAADGSAQKRKSAPKSLEVFQFLVPLLIVGIAYALYHYSREN
ncbi:hypothetical protein DCAR_0207891 [Daucus carota subsp. sativus]|uniref:Cytochrome b5 heme-binding domain-containing protein n=1 Tax=Daucus carota subsp. sativus TaxID=79200 RepID=A0A166E678_DAUCS|nr:PREDICTED: cytochrome b5-like [Daucus carota subsp. sativus]XP_017231796.1 PREDICTED: cytochrome b5-like [Daucus carota subsp. sativus]WOG88656.1 hypothetical protein DCAR_0207891 [Daucus carota subsp. sativus]